MLGAGDNTALRTRRVAGRKSLSISNTISRLKRSLGRTNSMDVEAETSSTHKDDQGITRNNDQYEIDLDEPPSPYTSDENTCMSTNPNFLASGDSNSAELALNESDDCANTGTTESAKMRYSCNHCNYIAETYSGWNHHFKRLHSRLFQNGKLVRHYTKATTSPKTRVPTLYSCILCNYITLSMVGFVIHSTKVHPKRKVNPLKRGSPITTDTNRKYLEALYLSRDESPKTKNKVHKLLAAHHRDSRVLEEVPRFISTKCIMCNQNFATTKMLGQHYEMCHSGQGPKRNNDTGLYCCKLCSYEALTRLALYKHYIKNHFMDAFFAWSVPSLEPMLQEKQSEWNRNNGKTVDPYEETPSELEKLDASLPDTMTWNVEDAADQHIARETIPCISCDFATRNVIELLSHYKIAHDGLYPNGFGIFVLECLIKHANPIYVPNMEAEVIDKLYGAWVDHNGQLHQYYTYECRICEFTSDRFVLMFNHFTKVHPSVNCTVLNVIRKVARSLPAEAEFSQCSTCGFIVLDAVELEMQEHCEGKNGVACCDKSVYNLLERRHCQHCDFVGNVDAMQWHYAESHDCYIVLWCNLKLDDSHFSTQEFSCCVCEFSTKCDWDLAFHYKEKHFQKAITFETLQTGGQSKYRCVLCSTMTNSLPKMITHHQYCKYSLLLTQSSPESQKRYLSCKHCNKVFTTSSALWSHITQHHCSFSQLFSASDLQEHTLRYGYWTSRLMSIENHTGSQAESNSKHSASVVRCSQPIQRNNNYQAVARKISSEIDENSTSKIGGSLSGESLIVVFKCKFCSLSTALRSSLTEHLTLVHKHDITFRCFGCEKQFSSISDCILHHLHIHGLDISQKTAYNFLLSDISTLKHDSVRFTCTLCGFRGLSRIVVLNHFSTCHIRSHHTGRIKWKKNGPYSCWCCEYYTKNATSMRAHLSSRHERTVSYHSLTKFRSLETDTAKSSDSSDEDYVPSKRNPHNSTKSRKMRCHRLSLQCAISEDRDSFCLEVLRCTHVRYKHNTKHPYTCRFCMKAFVCASAFLKHCAEKHPQWCSLSFTPQHIIMVPDTNEIKHMRKHKEEEQDWVKSKNEEIGVIRNSNWPCELCGSKHYSLKDLQQHACSRHTNRKLLLCRYCDFTSLNEKKMVAHSRQHIRRNSQNEQPSSTFSQRVDDEANVNDDDVIDLVTMESNSTESCQQAIIEQQTIDIDEPQTSSGLQAFDNNDSGHDQFFMSSVKARKSIRRNAGNDFSSAKTPTSNIQHDIYAGMHGKDLASCDDPVTVESGLISCSKCKFSCTDAHRMTTHIKSTHTKVKSFSCKFCDFLSDNFSSLDCHLAKFHKIVKNHQLGLRLQVQSASTNETNTYPLLESRSRYLYTPTPCLPILREEVIYLDDETEDSTIAPGFPVLREGQNIDELKCSYCGFSADSTFILEMHMRRHEGAFQDESGGCMSYKMTKMNMTSFS